MNLLEAAGRAADFYLETGRGPFAKILAQSDGDDRTGIWIGPESSRQHHAALLYLRYLEHAAQRRWEDAHGVPWQHADQIDAMCAWCGETIARDIPFNPRHADSKKEAMAICHALVEYHIINGCEAQRGMHVERPEDTAAIAAAMRDPANDATRPDVRAVPSAEPSQNQESVPYGVPDPGRWPEPADPASPGGGIRP